MVFTFITLNFLGDIWEIPVSYSNTFNSLLIMMFENLAEIFSSPHF